MTTKIGSGLFGAFLDAIHGSDEKISGQAVTRLSASLLSTDTEVLVESTVGFGDYVDGSDDARLLVGGEVIGCSTRTLTSFAGLTRGVGNTPIKSVYPAGTVVYDLSQNKSALDLVRRGLLVDTAIGTDLDRIGRNLGLRRCSGLLDDTWRAVIKAVAYLAKQPPSAVITAMNALQGEGNYLFYERAVSSPNRFFVALDIPLATSLQGRFFLNSGETSVIQPGGLVDVGYAIVDSPFDGAPAIGSIRVVSGAFLVDGETFVLDDGVNPAVTFEFDSDLSVIQTATLRAVAFTAASTEEEVRDAIIIAITGAPVLDISAEADGAQRVALTNDTPADAGNVVITETVADTLFAVTGMAGGADPGVSPNLRVVPSSPLTREGYRDGLDLLKLYPGWSYLGSQITLGPGLPGGLIGTEVIVDYNAFQAHYLPPDAAFESDGDFPPYFADNLLAARCLLEQVRAAGVGVELSIGL